MAKPIVYKVFHWGSLLFKCVTVTLVIFQYNFLHNKLMLAASSMTAISAILLGVACMLGVKKSCRENTPPIVTIILIGIAGASTIAEAIIFGLIGFKENKYDGLRSAIFFYDCLCLITCIVLILIIIFCPPSIDQPDDIHSKNIQHNLQQNSEDKKDNVEINKN